MFAAALLSIACLMLMALAVKRRLSGAMDAAVLSVLGPASTVALAMPTEAEFAALADEAKKIPVKLKDLDDAIARAEKARGDWGQGPEARVKGLEKDLADAKAARDDLEKRLGGRLDEFETRMNRPGAGGHQGDKDHAAALKAFGEYLRKGTVSAELKTLATNDGPQGGFLLPAPMRGKLIEELVQISPIRANASVITITDGNALEIPRDEGSFTQGWVGETAARPATGNSTFAKLLVALREQYAFPQATQNMLDDVPDIEGYIARKTAQIFAKKEGNAFLLGDDVTQPEGILNNATIVAAKVKSGSAGAVAADGLLNLIADLPTEYAPRASLFMSRKTKFGLRKLKDSQNRYLWEPGLPTGSATPGSGLPQALPDTFAGVPIIETPDMPEIGAASKSILYTDFRLSYQIVDKATVSVLRDPYTNKPNVGFYSTRRVGGRVVLPNAARLQTLEA